MLGKRVGRCEKWNRCSLARSGADIAISRGGSPSCPECGNALTIIGDGRAGNGYAIFAAVAIVVFAGLAVVLITHHARKAARALAAPDRTTLSPTAERAPIESGTPHVILRLVGSNTIGASLAPNLAVAYLASRGDSNVAVTTAPNKIDFAATGRNNGQIEEIFIQAHKSQEAFEALASGTADIGMASRPINQQEIAMLQRLGDMTAAANEHVIGLDGIAVIVNRDNVVAHLTTDQLGAAFGGIVRDWANLGGQAGSIHVYARPDGSGTYEIFKSKILGDTGLLRADATRIEDSSQLSAAVAADPAGIGFVGLPYVGKARAVPISAIGGHFLPPTPFTVATEDYYLARRLYLYTGDRTAKPEIAGFVGFALSSEGQAVVERTGFTPLTVRPEAADAPIDSSQRFRRLVAGTLRLTTTFRFATGAKDLDSRAVQDTENLSAFLSSSGIAPDHVLLIGFTDDQGDSRQNLTLSRQRAARVAMALGERNLHGLQEFGFGAELPVANNATEDGRRLNRRVEVYLRQ